MKRKIEFFILAALLIVVLMLADRPGEAQVSSGDLFGSTPISLMGQLMYGNKGPADFVDTKTGTPFTVPPGHALILKDFIIRGTECYTTKLGYFWRITGAPGDVRGRADFVYQGDAQEIFSLESGLVFTPGEHPLLTGKGDPNQYIKVYVSGSLVRYW